MEHGRRRQPAPGVEHPDGLARTRTARVVTPREGERPPEQVSQNGALLIGQSAHAQREEHIQALGQLHRSLTAGPRQFDAAVLAGPDEPLIGKNGHCLIDIGRLQYQEPRDAHRAHMPGLGQR